MSKIEVNQISSQCGSTLTIGQSGDTVTLACGATQTGFGRTGTVDWCTTAKTAPFTGVSGKGYFVNTTCGAVTVTLPATPTAGDIISIKDYAGTWNTNAITVDRNGSKIGGGCSYNPSLTNQYGFISLIYVDATKGWLPTDFSTSDLSAAAVHITATGGTITCCGDYKIHTFTADGTFCVSAGAGPLAIVDYLVVAGGGGGGSGNGSANGGAGAGGYRESYCATTSGCYTASPLASATSLPVSIQGYPITVGGGGTGTYPNQGTNGSNSVFSTITSAGGGGGGAMCAPINGGLPGGSGGGAGAPSSGIPLGTAPVGSGNTPPVAPPQGNNGGQSFWTPGIGNGGGGGGGATAVGTNANPSPISGGPGGAGATTSISGSPTSYSGGGGGANESPANIGTGGLGGGGSGGWNGGNGTAGTVNTGGGGGAGGQGPSTPGRSGGSGIVIIRYKFQN
jgi:hypothetical protein